MMEERKKSNGNWIAAQINSKIQQLYTERERNKHDLQANQAWNSEDFYYFSPPLKCNDIIHLLFCKWTKYILSKLTNLFVL